MSNNTPDPQPSEDGDKSSQATPQDKDTPNLAALMHLLGLLNFATGLLGTLAQIILWMFIGKNGDAVDRHGCAALNFQISWLIYGSVALVLSSLTGGVGITAFVFVMVLVTYSVIQLICAFIGAYAAKRGSDFTYPLSLKLL